MKVCIVHDSQAGNGEQIASALRQSLEADGHSVSVGHVSTTDPAGLVSDPPDLLVVGAAIRAFTTSPATKRWLRGLGRALTRGDGAIPHAAVFLTHGLPLDKASGWGERLLARAERTRGIGSVYPRWLSGQVVEQLGPLEDGTLERFAGHARELAAWAGA